MAHDWRSNTRAYIPPEDVQVEKRQYEIKTQLPDFQVNDESKAVLKDILRSKDRDQKGYVNIDELGDCLEAFGFSPDDDDLQFLQVHMDDNGKWMWTPRQHSDPLMTLQWDLKSRSAREPHTVTRL